MSERHIIIDFRKKVRYKIILYKTNLVRLNTKLDGLIRFVKFINGECDL